MDVKQAVRTAKQYVAELFADEKPDNIGLEEVYLDDAACQWVVTIGFSRPWDQPLNALAVFGRGDTSSSRPRSFKVVRVTDDDDGQVVSVKARPEFKAP